MLSNKGYSLVMWAVIFAVAASGVYFMFTPMKRALQGNVMRSSDGLLWTMWGNTVESTMESDTETFISASSTGDLHQRDSTLETSGRITANANSNSVDTSEQLSWQQ